MIELPFLKNAWYVAGWKEEFNDVSPHARTILGEPLVFFRKTDATLVAMQDRCAHRWARLSLGRIEGDALRCMYHGLKYGTDGRCVEVPGQERIAKSLCVRSYPVIERHRLAWVWMGDATGADSQTIPDLSMLEEDTRRLYRGALDYQAHYSLINDNLLDLSHISFLHEKTVGRAVVGTANTTLKPFIPGGADAQPLERGVRVENWVSGPLARSVLVPKRVPDGDLWTRTDFLVPGIFISDDRMYPSGTAEHCRGQAPEGARPALSDLMSIQAVTPITARKSRYFFSFGPRASELEEEEADAMWQIVQETFAEDLQMIQAQQEIVDLHPGRQMAGITADRGLVLFRNLMKKLIAAETLPTTDAARNIS